jgi:hypothetical protein
MKLALILVGLVVVGVVVYLLAARAQRRGWVNFRAAGSGVTAGVAEVGRLLDPPTQHVAEAREAARAPQREADPDDH